MLGIIIVAKRTTLWCLFDLHQDTSMARKWLISRAAQLGSRVREFSLRRNVEFGHFEERASNTPPKSANTIQVPAYQLVSIGLPISII